VLLGAGDEAATSPAGELVPFPAVGGVRFWSVTVPPDESGAPPQEFLHTLTLDVGIVLSGQIVQEMEDGTSAELSAGQAFAQQSTPWMPSSRLS